jgi:hypothetical protein
MPPAPTTALRCTVPGVGSEQQPWRQVRATGFTFCVPLYWRPDGRGRGGVDARTWRGDAGTITWGTVESVVTTRDIVTVVPMRPGRSLQMDPRDYQQPCSTPLRFDFESDGVTITTSQYQCQGTYTTTAFCTVQPAHLVGEAHSGAGAAMQLAVIRTIRLLPRTP